MTVQWRNLAGRRLISAVRLRRRPAQWACHQLTKETVVAPAARPSALVVWAALITVYIVWGSTYLAIRVVVESDIPPVLGMGMRFLTAAVIFLAFLGLWHGWSSLRVTWAELRGAAIMGVLLLVGGNGVVAIAEQTVPSGLTALIIGAVPLWFVLLRYGGGDRPRGLTWLGVAVGFAGIAAISLPRGGIDGIEAWGVVLLIAATMSWAVGSYLSPRLGLPRRTTVAVTYEMLAAGVIMISGSLLFGDGRTLDVAAVPAKGWIALGYLVVFGSLLAFTAYGFALAHAPLSLVGTYAYVNPVVAVTLGWAILSEPVTAIVVGGGALVIVGVALVVSAERPRRPTDPDPELDDAAARVVTDPTR
jgi:drug/metabolite transporter (DMT)-like permease